MSYIKVPKDVVEQAISQMGEGKDSKELEAAARRTSLRRYVELLPASMTKKQVKAIWKVAKDTRGDPTWKAEIEFMVQAARDPSSVKVHTVSEFDQLFARYMNEGFIKGWLFERADHGALTPYLVLKCTYQAPVTSRYNHRHEHAEITLVYAGVDGKEQVETKQVTFTTLLEAYKDMNREEAEKATEAIRQAEQEADEAEAAANEEDEDGKSTDAKRKLRQELKEKIEKLKRASRLGDGVPMDRILAQLDLYKETDELHSSYEKQTDRFMKLVTKYGAQLRVRGDGEPVSSTDDDDDRWYYRYYRYRRGVSMLVDGRPSRAIMDTRPLVDMEKESQGKRRKSDAEEGETFVDIDSLTKDDFFATKPTNESNVFTTSGIDGQLIVPLHLELKVFHLEKHLFYKVHVVNLAPYKYKPEMRKQLILPDDVMELAEMLIQSEEEDAEDIVEGKSQGSLITCVGDPGLGKTLLAEVLSEAVGKPLYKIQAAQLGLDPESLEQQLKKLLHRAERWGTVLMIDEANAYIHDRGVDVKQNAIVGVFLRLLEYYRGTMILTTNQTNADGTDMDIDDAILNRSSAVIHFELPTPENAKRIWKVQADLLKANISDDTIAKAVAYFKYSGRSIRQLLRLTNRLVRAKNEKEITFARLQAAAKFIPVSRKEKKAQAASEKAKLKAQQ